MLTHQFKRSLETLHSQLSEICKAVEKQESAIRDASETASQQQREIPRIIAAAITQASEKDVPAYEKSQRDKEYRQQGRLILVTFLAFLAAAVYAGIAAKQLCTMNQTLHEMQTQTANSRDVMERDQRAWVSVLDLKQVSDTTFSLVFVNTWKTPARDFKVSAGADVENLKGKEHELPGRGVIAPDGKFTSYLRGNGVVTIFMRLVIHGRVDYYSIFGGHHWTTFCYLLIPPKGKVPSGFISCESGNEVDSNPH